MAKISKDALICFIKDVIKENGRNRKIFILNEATEVIMALSRKVKMMIVLTSVVVL